MRVLISPGPAGLSGPVSDLVFSDRKEAGSRVGNSNGGEKKGCVCLLFCIYEFSSVNIRKKYTAVATNKDFLLPGVSSSHIPGSEK